MLSAGQIQRSDKFDENFAVYHLTFYIRFNIRKT
jgi:hypothetical protein